MPHVTCVFYLNIVYTVHLMMGQKKQNQTNCKHLLLLQYIEFRQWFTDRISQIVILTVVVKYLFCSDPKIHMKACLKLYSIGRYCFNKIGKQSIRLNAIFDRRIILLWIFFLLKLFRFDFTETIIFVCLVIPGRGGG